MFDYRISIHAFYAEACRKFALSHNLATLGPKAGMSVQVLRNKLNPEQSHRLTIEELMLLTDLTEDPTLLDGMLAQINCLPSVPVNEMNAEQLPVYVMKATAAIGSVAAEAVSTERMTACRQGAFTAGINSAIRCLTLAGMSLQARIHSNPALSSTAEVISGLGASIGLS
ncbi:phage regulatory CII family protein [Rouxiella badensis]|uniref:phage regulatory CII family protein n=1 Tax=Rouxiella badensis TaxID=1646377 RepID=UPI001D15DCD4|nr:phage regulatory CII family protein [Rouxiella badensis]MCC3704139.1 phage regulatory CII family protein [Rouxiella badensis]